MNSNDSARGASVQVSLPGGAQGPPGGTHTERYFDEINRRLDSVRGKGCEELRRVLAEIAKDIQSGTFPQ